MRANLLLLLSVLFCLVISCRKKCHDPANPDCENYDPCYGKKPTSADFVMEIKIAERYFPADTIVWQDIVRFTALHDADSFVWQLGSETIRKKQFTKTWFPDDSWITAKLIVYRTPNNKCFPEDDGIDTVIKRFYIWPEEEDYGRNPRYIYLPIYGTYTGTMQSKPGQTVSVTLHDTGWVNEVGEEARVGILRGIPYPGKRTDYDAISRNVSAGDIFDVFSPLRLHINFRGLGGSSGRPINPPVKGYAWLDDKNRDKIIIEYSYQDSLHRDLNDPWTNDKFEGYRIK